MARSYGGRASQRRQPRRRMGRLRGCLVWILALLVVLLVLSLLFGGFQRGTRAGGTAPVRPVTSSVTRAPGS